MIKPGFDRKLPVEDVKQAEETEEKVPQKIRARIRFDYKGKARPARFLFGGKRTEEAAEELRDKQAALWRNVPVQGIFIERIDLGEIYTVYDEDIEDEVAYAPLELDVTADALSYLVRFAVREEFRRLLILEPPAVKLSLQEMEQLFFEVHTQANNQLVQKFKRLAD